MVINLPNFLVVRIVLLFEPFVPGFAARFNALPDVGVDHDAPLSLDTTSLVRVDSSSYLYCFTDLGLRCEGIGKVF